MAVSDAFVVGEDWISEHYFTTDAKSAVVPGQGARAPQGSGTTARSSTARAASPRPAATSSGPSPTLVGRRGDRPRPHAYDLDDRPASTVLGYRTGEFVLKTEGPLTWVSTPGLTADAPLVICRRLPADRVDDALAKDADTLLEPVDDRGRHGHHKSAARMLSALFVPGRRPALRAASSPAGGQWSPSRSVGPRAATSPSTSSSSPSATTPRRGGEVDRALTCLERRLPRRRTPTATIWWSRGRSRSRSSTPSASRRTSARACGSRSRSSPTRSSRRRAAQGLAPLPPEQAQPLAMQSLRYLYRILFLLYAEASPELGVLPTGASEYEQGYSLDRLRELTLVELHRAAQPGTAPTSTSRSAALPARRHRARTRRAGERARRQRRQRRGSCSTRCAPTSSLRRPPPTSTTSGSATRRSSRCCATCCSARRPRAATEASSPTSSSASTSSARSTRASCPTPASSPRRTSSRWPRTATPPRAPGSCR